MTCCVLTSATACEINERGIVEKRASMCFYFEAENLSNCCEPNLCRINFGYTLNNIFPIFLENLKTEKRKKWHPRMVIWGTSKPVYLIFLCLANLMHISCAMWHATQMSLWKFIFFLSLVCTVPCRLNQLFGLLCSKIRVFDMAKIMLKVQSWAWVAKSTHIFFMSFKWSATGFLSAEMAYHFNYGDDTIGN